MLFHNTRRFATTATKTAAAGSGSGGGSIVRRIPRRTKRSGSGGWTCSRPKETVFLVSMLTACSAGAAFLVWIFASALLGTSFFQTAPGTTPENHEYERRRGRQHRVLGVLEDYDTGYFEGFPSSMKVPDLWPDDRGTEGELMGDALRSCLE